MKPTTVLTIGHSNHKIEKFVELLRQHGVWAIADVRSSPYSRFNPDFNREFLSSALKTRGIIYVFLGRELGARPEDSSCYEQGRVVYKKLAETHLFKEGLGQIVNGAQTLQVALLCAEREPLACHRTLLVSPELIKVGVSVAHIHSNGALEYHSEAMGRLLEMYGKSEPDLYRSREEVIADVCALQAKRIAYVSEELPEEASA